MGKTGTGLLAVLMPSRWLHFLEFVLWALGFVSGFGFRVSDFEFPAHL
jgi:hypothetical protein